MARKKPDTPWRGKMMKSLGVALGNRPLGAGKKVAPNAKGSKPTLLEKKAKGSKKVMPYKIGEKSGSPSNMPYNIKKKSSKLAPLVGKRAKTKKSKG